MALNLLKILDYIAAVVSAAVESTTVESTTVVSTATESTATESVASSVALSELQATIDNEIAKAKNPNLNKFFMLIFFLIVINLFFIHLTLKGNPSIKKKNKKKLKGYKSCKFD